MCQIQRLTYRLCAHVKRTAILAPCTHGIDSRTKRCVDGAEVEVLRRAAAHEGCCAECAIDRAEEGAGTGIRVSGTRRADVPGGVVRLAGLGGLGYMGGVVGGDEVVVAAAGASKIYHYPQVLGQGKAR
ncbi:MAG: hypothetical protein M1819_002024 [Sarea resinae]|nr:MAG: hypothetical protein M1819_002024 [Sarea resinae]